jgi:hypothetical protein
LVAVEHLLLQLEMQVMLALIAHSIVALLVAVAVVVAKETTTLLVEVQAVQAVVDMAEHQEQAVVAQETHQAQAHHKVIMVETLLQVQVAVLAVVEVVVQKLLAMQEAEQLAEMVVAEQHHQLLEHL